MFFDTTKREEELQRRLDKLEQLYLSLPKRRAEFEVDEDEVVLPSGDYRLRDETGWFRVGSRVLYIYRSALGVYIEVYKSSKQELLHGIWIQE